jgi:hypothetical protein
MAQCSSYANLSCIGSNGTCKGECRHAKKDREDAERDSAPQKTSGKIGFWGWVFIVLIGAYVLGSLGDN